MNVIPQVLNLIASTAGTRTIHTLLFGDLTDDCNGTIIFKVVVLIINILLAGVIVLGTIGIIIAGAQIMSARDNAEMVARGRKRIIDVIIGVAIYAFMYVILSFLIPGGISLDVVGGSGNTCPDHQIAMPVSPSDPSSPSDPTGGDPSSPSEGDHGVRDFTMCGMTFDVVKITVNGVKDDGSDNTGLKKFIRDKVYKYHIDQSDGKVYDLSGGYSNSTAQNGHCDIVSRNLAYDMYYDTVTADSCSASGHIYDRGTAFTLVPGGSMKGNYQNIYDDIMEGRPVVNRITINDGGSQKDRHFGVIVGVKKGANRSDLSSSDFLYLETFGGVLWNNTSGVTGGQRSSGGNGCEKTSQNRFPYDKEHYRITQQTGPAEKDCGH